MMLYIVKAISRYPPFKKKEEQTRDQEDASINGAREKTELHCPKKEINIIGR